METGDQGEDEKWVRKQRVEQTSLDWRTVNDFPTDNKQRLPGDSENKDGMYSVGCDTPRALRRRSRLEESEEVQVLVGANTRVWTLESLRKLSTVTVNLTRPLKHLWANLLLGLSEDAEKKKTRLGPDYHSRKWDLWDKILEAISEATFNELPMSSPEGWDCIDVYVACGIHNNWHVQDDKYQYAFPIQPLALWWSTFELQPN